MTDSTITNHFSTLSNTAMPASSKELGYGIASLTKYVRVHSEPSAKFVMFDFAIGDPSLFVELVLPHKAFEKFCQNNQVIMMNEEQMAKNDAEANKWRYGEEDTLVGKNHNQFYQNHQN